MSSNVIEAGKVFLISSIFDLCITSIILLLGIFVFINDPNLSIPAIWPAITMDVAPLFKGLLAISLLVMAMSTADSSLNTCSVMVIHDIAGSFRTNKISDVHQLLLARVTSFVVGILAMSLAFNQKDLLALFVLANDFSIPITTAPLLLAILGLRSSSRTALIGMITGIVSILVWQNYLPDIDGAFPAMLANGMAMLLAHYIFPKREHESWEKPSLDYKQLQQAKQGRFFRFKQHMKGLFSGLQHMPLHNHHVVLLAFYILITNWLPLLNQNMLHIDKNPKNQVLLYWALGQCLVALAMIIYVILSKKAPVPFNRYVWSLILLFCMPIDALWHMAYAQDQRMALVLSFWHFGMLDLLLPTYVGSTSLGGLKILAAVGHIKKKGK